jgi:hypothetical protein
LFSITQRQTNTTTNFILTDVSAYTERYNKFSVTEGTTFNVDSGEFLYRVYAQTSPSNLDPTLADELVEARNAKSEPNVAASDVFYTPSLMEKDLRYIVQFEEGDLTTQDDLLLTTQGSFATIDFITQSGDILLTQSGEILQGRIYDFYEVYNIGYKVSTNINRFINYIDTNKVNQVSISQKTYNPSITEKIYGN